MKSRRSQSEESPEGAGPGGRGEIEQVWPDPEPAPVTTIAWRLSHLAVNVFGLRVSTTSATAPLPIRTPSGWTRIA